MLKMKSVVFFVFLTLTLVLCHQDVHKSGAKRSLKSCEKTNNKALDNLTGNKKPIQGKLSVTSGCAAVMYQYKSGNKTTGILYDPREFCYVEGDSNKAVTVKSKAERPAPGGEQCATLPAFQAAFLVQDDDANTYMFLNPLTSHWFFTRPLGGCDMFVARNQRNREVPIVIHSNLNSCGTKLINLQAKGNSVDTMLRTHPEYTLIARVYGAPPPGPGRQEVDAYIQRYKASHPGINVMFYDNHPPAKLQTFQFIGQYNAAKSWIFTLKGEIDGKIFGQFSV